MIPFLSEALCWCRLPTDAYLKQIMTQCIPCMQCNVQCIPCMQCNVQCIPCMQCNVQCIPCMQCNVQCIPCMQCNVQCIPCMQCNVQCIPCMQCNVQCIPCMQCNVQCIPCMQCNVHWTIYIMRCTLYTVQMQCILTVYFKTFILKRYVTVFASVNRDCYLILCFCFADATSLS